ncbi:immunoglobulin superfamily member 1-like [Anolis carolinensis]|uniref:immunoglobulin superfamily member 1-like n=1 Tax=Anolis carolinensis TaxID=28377 RepID=UPI002F2B5FE8
MVRGQVYPAPSISVSPSVVVALGGNATISCKSERYQHMTFLLVKGTVSPENVMEKQAEKYEVTFSVSNARSLDGGIYWCCFVSALQEWSHFSVKAYIKIRVQVHLKPSIAVRPKELVPLGESATIHCKDENNRRAKYSLIKEEALDIIQEETGGRKGATFTIDNVTQLNVGIYWCDYKPDSGSLYSHFSERVYLNVTDHGFPKPSIKMVLQEEYPSGVNVTILCEGPENNLTFFLHKSMDLRASQETEPGSNRARFLVQIINLEDAGNYTCQYHKSGNPFVWSVPSNPAQLVVRESIPIIIWANVAAGCLLLVLLVLLLTYIFYRKRRKGKWTLCGCSTAKVTKQPVAVNLEPVAEAVPDEVSYAVLRHCSVKIKPTADQEGISEPCVYASVAK